MSSPFFLPEAYPAPTSFPATLGPRLLRRIVWRFFLAWSADMTIIGPLDKARNRSLTCGLDIPGSCSFDLPVDDPLAEIIWPWKTCIVAVKNGIWRWSGPVLTVESALPSNKTTVNAVGWFEKLNRRLVTEPLTFTDQFDGQIIFNLVDHANAYGTTRITPGALVPGQTRTVTYAVDANIGQEIAKLSDLEAGTDYRIDPETRQIDAVRYIGIERPEVQFGYNWGPNNILQFNERIDGATVVNDIKPRGDLGKSGFADDPFSKEDYDTHQEAPSLSSVREQNILDAYANEEIVFRKDPRVTYEFVPKPAHTGRVPSLFEDYDFGDIVFTTAHKGRVQLDKQPTRVFNADLAIDNNGIERIQRMTTSLVG